MTNKSAFELMDKIEKVKKHPNFFALEQSGNDILVTFKYSYVGEPNCYHYSTRTL